MTTRPARDVLVVDDDASLRDLIGASLRAAGLTSDTAGDGADGLELLQKNRYDVVLLDMIMPTVDGSVVLERVRGMRLGDRERPVILVMTASDAREKLAGADDLVQAVIKKPLSVRGLTELVQDCVKARDQARSRSTARGA